MSRLEDLAPNASIRGILPSGLVTVVNVQWHGSEALELTYKTPEGKVANELLYRHDEWPAPGFEDTELGVLMEPEVRHGTSEVYTRVQA